ncbi:sensor histidine kinase [Actinoalloteichus hymeniacidonis]|uniref:histidine kinase n=1 Tax=Actinoalloteichus hymeniacidonis TaxID=340345 RepID=A0AAC9HNG6_9PSEU|nr:histidine kinase [Actinoalloteichus hymeniacidonis]AOS62622.1 histidine kinase [Actinoalloteichus hymeniacidonis]MBB5909346.1 signal transduction histidine kinase [Actinoalloteichus hymeniacidonis]
MRFLLRVLRPVVAATTYRRWVHLILGGALLVPFVALTGVAVEILWRPHATSELPVLIVATLAALPLVAFIGLAAPVRELSVSAARALLGGPVAELPIGRARSRQARRRTSLWFMIHLVIGGVLAALTLTVPPAVVIGLLAPLLSELRPPSGWPIDDLGPLRWWLPPLSVLVLLGLILLAAGSGRLLSRLAGSLLGPTPEERAIEQRRRSMRRAERHRLARELHDSVGHALSVVSVQAGAARHTVSTDVDFAVAAMRAVEAAARDAQTDLDHVLGLLRDEESDDESTGRLAPTLLDLRAVVDAARTSGTEVAVQVDGILDTLASEVSREAYRIVQECLTNCLRHAPGAPVRIRLAVTAEELRLVIDNPLPEGRARRREGTGGGRGLLGVRERVAMLGGSVDSGVVDGRWTVSAILPTPAGGS